ncbi:MAG: hypothetical protein ABUT20_15480 [Bacteroidota bacterium]
MIKLLFIIVIVLVGCNSHPAISMEGIYTREAVGEYSHAFDTLMIFEYDKSAATYLVRRKTAFMRLKEGVEQPVEYREQQMITDYNEDTHQLTDQKTGRVLSFKEGQLLFGTARYKKIGTGLY